MSADRSSSTDGRGSLRDHVPNVVPPPSLANRVRATLESRGLVQPEKSGRDARSSGRARWFAVGRRVAGAAALLAAGAVLGMAIRGARPEPPGTYVLLLYGDPPDDTGAVHVAREREYGRWASTLDGARWVGGHELAGVIAEVGSSTSPPAPGSERLAGYFVIDAPSRERATEVARSCPHVRYGGRVVVMAIAS